MKTKEAKRKDAERLRCERFTRTDKEQLFVLNERGVKASKERARLCNRIGISVEESFEIGIPTA